MTKTICVHDVAFESFQRILGHLKERDQRDGAFLWRVTAGRVLEMLIWYFEESMKLQCGKCSSLLGQFKPEIGSGGRPRMNTEDYRLLPYTYSMACKVMRAERGHQFMPTHSEVLEFIKQNPDIGLDRFKRAVQDEATKIGVAQRGPIPSAILKKEKPPVEPKA